MKEKFYEIIKKEPECVLATSGSNVTMRTISPAYYNENILFFTNCNSNKYKQLKENNKCCIKIENYFVEAEAIFYGSTMLDSNKELREAYNIKFPGAFDEGEAFNGRESDFVLLKPIRVTGWNFTDGYPTSPFEILL